jgi:hypothetical protein
MLENPVDITDDLWEEACRREDVLRELVERFPKGLPGTDKLTGFHAAFSNGGVGSNIQAK